MQRKGNKWDNTRIKKGIESWFVSKLEAKKSENLKNFQIKKKDL